MSPYSANTQVAVCYVVLEQINATSIQHYIACTFLYCLRCCGHILIWNKNCNFISSLRRRAHHIA